MRIDAPALRRGLLTAFVCWWLTAKASFFPFSLMPFRAGTTPRFVVAALLSLAFIGLYPFFESWVTGDKREHHLLQHGRLAPGGRRLVHAAKVPAAS